MNVTLTSEQIAIDRIKIEKDREPNEEIVRQLMISIPLVGLLQPIILCRAGTGLGVKLVAGLNRLEAMKRLKCRAILARVVNGDTDEIRAWCEQAERDENAVRRINPPPSLNVISLTGRKRATA